MNYNEWAFHDITPIYLQLVKKVEYAILSTNISAGEELPSIRVMAKLLKISMGFIFIYKMSTWNR